MLSTSTHVEITSSFAYAILTPTPGKVLPWLLPTMQYFPHLYCPKIVQTPVDWGTKSLFNSLVHQPFQLAVWYVTSDCTFKPFSCASDIAQFSNNKKKNAIASLSVSLHSLRVCEGCQTSLRPSQTLGKQIGQCSSCRTKPDSNTFVINM